jgi:N-acetylglutamate synthase-like GNAT family acetyltransferase
MGVEIVSISQRPELLGVVAAWCHQAFASPGTRVEAVEEAVREHLSRRAYPFTLIALIDGTPVGCVHGVESELDDRPELEPFVAALYVVPERRRGGVGGVLLAAAESQALRAGFAQAYLCAWSSPEWYARHGWRVVEEAAGPKGVPLMTKRLGVGA